MLDKESKKLKAHKGTGLSDKLVVGSVVFNTITRDDTHFIHHTSNAGDFLNPENKFLREQLIATQQALDISCQTNQILIKRLKMAEEGFRRIMNYEEGDPTGGGTGVDLIQGLAKTTLNAIKGK